MKISSVLALCFVTCSIGMVLSNLVWVLFGKQGNSNARDGSKQRKYSDNGVCFNVALLLLDLSLLGGIFAKLL